MGNFKSRYLPLKELPQNIAGRISSRAWKKWLEVIPDSTLGFIQDYEQQYNLKIYVVTRGSHDNHWLLKGVNSHSCGKYICIVYSKNQVVFKQLVDHEKGHSLQSKGWWWLYLPVIGLPSIMRNLWDRWAHKNWTEEKSNAWYYGGWPEADADRRGGVVRVF